MPELFDLIAGSETGAIIASSLVLPNTDAKTKSTQKNAFFADKSKTWFEDNVDTLYHDTNIPAILNFFITVIIAAAFAVAAYIVVQKTFHYQEFDDHVRDLQFLLKIEKKKAKGRALPAAADGEEPAEARELRIQKDFTGECGAKHQALSKVYTDLKVIQDGKFKHGTDEGDKEEDGDDEHKIESLIAVERELDQLIEGQNRKLGYKWYAVVLVGVVNFLLFYYGVIPAVVYLFASTKESSVLREALVKASLIPSGTSIQDVITDDLFITAWDLNNRSPRFFSKWSQKNLVEPTF